MPVMGGTGQGAGAGSGGPLDSRSEVRRVFETERHLLQQINASLGQASRAADYKHSPVRGTGNTTAAGAGDDAYFTLTSLTHKLQTLLSTLRSISSAGNSAGAGMDPNLSINLEELIKTMAHLEILCNQLLSSRGALRNMVCCRFLSFLYLLTHSFLSCVLIAGVHFGGRKRWDGARSAVHSRVAGPVVAPVSVGAARQQPQRRAGSSGAALLEVL